VITHPLTKLTRYAKTVHGCRERFWDDSTGNNRLLTTRQFGLVISGYFLVLQCCYYCTTPSARQQIAGFMTRNNLADQLSWLLRNVALSKPPQQTFPCASDTSSSNLSQSSSIQISSGSQPRSFSNTNSQTTVHPRALVSNNASDPSVWGVDFVDTPQVTVVDDSMVRLTSTTKSKRPTLVSQPQQHLPTPSATGDSRAKTRLAPVSGNASM
jgi:hypothetical protein